MSLAKDLECIVNCEGSKADRARALFDMGCDRSDVSELLDMNYSQAHSIWKKLQAQEIVNGSAQIEETISASGMIVRKSHGRILQMSPGQTRYLTQDGHEIVKVDKQDGVFCRKCGEKLEHSLKWLGFVHKFSKADPTALEDRYA